MSAPNTDSKGAGDNSFDIARSTELLEELVNAKEAVVLEGTPEDNADNGLLTDIRDDGELGIDKGGKIRVERAGLLLSVM